MNFRFELIFRTTKTSFIQRSNKMCCTSTPSLIFSFKEKNILGKSENIFLRNIFLLDLTVVSIEVDLPYTSKWTSRRMLPIFVAFGKDVMTRPAGSHVYFQNTNFACPTSFFILIVVKIFRQLPPQLSFDSPQTSCSQERLL